MEPVIFWILSTFSVVSALAVVFFKKAVNGVMALIAFMLGMAGLYFLMGAQLVAFFQVIVYAGAVLVLFAFVIMLLNFKDAPLQPFASPAVVTAAISAVLLTCGISALTWLALQDASFAKAPAALQPVAGIRQIAGDLFTRHLLAFELTSVILFVAAVGAIVISRKEGNRS
jgi:NADH-quinone oxidoreductase subunit J